MIPLLDRARLFLSQGRFGSALETIRTGLPADSALALGLAEANFEAGHIDAALDLCAAVKARGALSPAEVAYSRRIVGSIELYRGNRSVALAELSAAASLAEAAGSFVEAAHAALRLFTALHSGGGQGKSSDALVVAKRLVLRSSHPVLMADLHMRVGQAEAQNGNAHAGLRHLGRSIEILRGAPHAAITARSKLALSSALALLCKNDEARQHAREALAAAETAGSVALTRLCRANLCQLHYRTGAVRAAARSSKDLLSSGDLPSTLRLAVLETYAASFLDLAGESSAIPEEVKDFLAEMGSASEPSWVACEAVTTQARLLARMRGLEVARDALEIGREMSASRSHLDNVSRLWFVEAELSAVHRDRDRAEQCLARATHYLGNPCSLELSALLERARGLTALVSGARSAGLNHLSRAERVFSAAGLRTEGRRTRYLCGAIPASEGYDSDVATSRRRFSVLFHVTAASYLATLVSSPRLLASELARYVEKCRIATSVSVLEEGTPNTLKDEGRYRIVCGGQANRRVLVEVEPKQEYAASQQVHALKIAVEHAVEVESKRSSMESFGAFLELECSSDDASIGVYAAPSMRALLKQVKQVARTDLSVLVTGDTGTGKDVVARDLHQFSLRASKPFIALNVAAIPREVLEGQLFGYRRGAFTGAVNDAKGMIREAEGGTLFIDEIGDLSPDLQPKLLRFLESGEIQPLGERPQRVDVRIVAATNARLETLAREGRFREDLYYRLNVVTLTIPPLRDRREEIPTLINHFLTVHAKQAAKAIPQLTPRALERLSAYDWPGNVRQLTNELKRLVALSDEDELVDIEHLAPSIRDEREPHAPAPSDASSVTLNLDRELQELYDDLERAAIARAMVVSRQNQAESARRLGITRKGLYLKRKRLGLADDITADADEDREADVRTARSAS